MFVKKRTLVFFICLIAVIFAVMAGFLIKFAVDMGNGKRSVAYSYQQQFAVLAESLENINLSLEKSLYVSSPYQAVTLAASVWKEAGEASAALGLLPVYELQLQNITKFLNQTGEYVLSVSKELVNGGELDEEQRETMTDLSKQAEALSAKMSELQYTVNTENRSYDGLLDFIQLDDRPQEDSETEESVEAMASENDGDNQAAGEETTEDEKSEFASENPLIEMEMSVTMPELNYNGLFSEHLSRKKSVFLSDKEAITEKEAKNRAAYILDCGLNELETDSDYISYDVKCYGFKTEDTEICVTMREGYCFYFEKNREVGDAALTDEEAIKKGLAFLKKLKFANMEASYAYSSGNVLSVDYIFVYKDVKHYTDKIRLSIALDNGEVIGMDTQAYLFAHTTNRKYRPALSQEDALEAVNPSHEVKNISLAYIPTQSYTEPEKLCYEIECVSGSRTLLIFINALTGTEEDVKLLYEDENGKYLM